GATKSRRRSYFFMNNTLPSRADFVRNAEKKYLQSWRNECTTSLQYRRKALYLTWHCFLGASGAGALTKFGAAWGCSGVAGFGINTRTFGLGAGAATVGGCTVGGETGGSDSCDSDLASGSAFGDSSGITMLGRNAFSEACVRTGS